VATNLANLYRSIVFNEDDRLACPVRWSTVLLEYEELARDLTYGR